MVPTRYQDNFYLLRTTPQARMRVNRIVEQNYVYILECFRKIGIINQYNPFYNRQKRVSRSGRVSLMQKKSFITTNQVQVSGLKKTLIDITALLR